MLVSRPLRGETETSLQRFEEGDQILFSLRGKFQAEEIAFNRIGLDTVGSEAGVGT